MTITQRPFSTQQDAHQMLGLARQYPEEHLHVVDLPYRFSSWAFDDPENIRLWFAVEQLVAWSALQTPFWTIDYACHPEYEASLHRELIAWAARRAQETQNTPYARPAWFIMAFSGQADRIRDLEQAAFQCQRMPKQTPGRRC